MKMSTLNNGPRRDGLTIDGVVQTRRTSLTLPKKMSIEAWKKVGQQIWRISDSSTWWLGDWLVYGQRRFPDRYQRAIEETSLDYQTLRNYAWVARKFSPGRRRASLSLQHHAEVAALPEPLQDEWLDRAQELGWSRNRLRAHIRETAERQLAELAAEVQVRIEISAEQRTRWESAAGRARHDLGDWIVAMLNRAAVQCHAD
ncbi:LmbU family transcriptional regulator [Nonomuraea rubra]